jgi:O-antigen/teichoic acid export membrane protein
MQGDQPSASIQARLALASIASAASFVLTLLQSVFMVPLLLTAWSPSEYGEWVVVSSTFGMATALDTGLQNFVGNLFAMESGNRIRIHQWLGSGIRAVAITASALAIFMIVYGLLRGARGEDIQTYRALFILFTYWIAIGSVGGIAVRLYAAHGLQSRSLWLSVVQRLTMVVALILAVWSGGGLLLGTLAFAVAGALVGLVTLRDIHVSFPFYTPWLGAGSWGAAFRLVGSASGMMVIGALDSVSFAVLVALTDAWASASAVAVFGAVRTVSSAVMQASAVILTPLAPDLSRFAAVRDCGRTSAMLASAWLIATGPIAIASTSLLPVTEAGFEQWTRGTLSFPRPLVVTLVAAVLVRQWTSPLAMLLFCTNAVRPQFFISIARCLATVGTAFISFSSLGVAGMGLAVLSGELIAAVVVAVATRLVYPGLCDQRCIRGATLAMLQVLVSAAAIAAWWWAPSLRWESWFASMVIQALAMIGQWFNLHQAARERIVSLFPLATVGASFNRRTSVRTGNGSHNDEAC